MALTSGRGFKLCRLRNSVRRRTIPCKSESSKEQLQDSVIKRMHTCRLYKESTRELDNYWRYFLVCFVKKIVGSVRNADDEALLKGL